MFSYWLQSDREEQRNEYISKRDEGGGKKSEFYLLF